MAMKSAEIERLIREAMPDAQVRIEDLRGDGDHFAAYVTSQSFQGKTRVQQHQLVYQALRGAMGEQLHALALQTSSAVDGTRGSHSSRCYLWTSRPYIRDKVVSSYSS